MATLVDPPGFREAFAKIPLAERDSWLDAFLGLTEPLADSEELPRGCVPYLPCSVLTLAKALTLADVVASDVFIDVGSGVGRATAFAHVMTGATAIGIEIQPALVRDARALIARLQTPCVSVVEGDAIAVTDVLERGTVFFLYCPFSGARLETVMSCLEAVARGRQIRVCCVDLPALACPWLASVATDHELTVYRSRAI